MTRVLVYEDEDVRVFDIYDADGNLIGQDTESKMPPETACPTCGRDY